MKRACSFILVFALSLAVPAYSSSHAGMDPFDMSVEGEDRTPDLFRIQTESNLICSEDSPLLVAEQKEAEQKEPDEGKEPDKFAPILGEAAGGKEPAPEEKEETAHISDPFESWNKAMFQFNDKLYFWFLKPVAQTYNRAVSEPIRNLFYNFFDNLRAPARLVNNLLQGKMKGAGNELIRFVFNSTAGLGGLADAAKELLHIQKTSVDFGQTLGRYGVGQWWYIVWPVIGPSSPRDTLGFAVDRAMYPFSYISYTNISFGVATGVAFFETVNNASFHVGEYEAFKEAAIDPYFAMRDAYVQNRRKMVEE